MHTLMTQNNHCLVVSEYGVVRSVIPISIMSQQKKKKKKV